MRAFINGNNLNLKNFGLIFFETEKQEVVKARLLAKLKRQQVTNQVKK